MLITKLSNIMYAVTRGLTLRESHTPPQTTSSNPTTNHPLESSRSSSSSSSSTRPDQTQPGTRTEHLSLCGTTRPPYPHSHSHHLFPPSPAQHSPGAMQFFREFVLVLLGQNGMRSGGGGGGGDGGTLLQWIFGVRWWVQEYKKNDNKAETHHTAHTNTGAEKCGYVGNYYHQRDKPRRCEHRNMSAWKWLAAVSLPFGNCA